MNLYREKLLAGTLTIDDVQKHLLERASSDLNILRYRPEGLDSSALVSELELESAKKTNIAVGGELVLVQWVLSDGIAAASMVDMCHYLSNPEEKASMYRAYAEFAFDFVEKELQRMFPGSKGNLDELRIKAFSSPTVGDGV